MAAKIQVSETKSGEFYLCLTSTTTIESAQKEIDDSGGDEEIVTLIDLDHDDPAIRAMVAIIELAVEAHPSTLIGIKPVGIEDLLLKIFLAGRSS